jgi:PAS domain S-box-containing protein
MAAVQGEGMKAVVIGGGPASRRLLESVRRQCPQAMDLEILALVAPKSDPASELALRLDIPLLHSDEEALGIDGLEAVIVMTGGVEDLHRLYRLVPAGIKVIDQATALKLCDLEDTLGLLRGEIDQKRRLEEDLVCERNQLQGIMDSLPDGVVVLDRDGRLEWVNARFQTITGLAPSDLVKGDRFHDPFQAGLEGEEPFEAASLVEQVKKTGQPVQFIHFVPGASRSYFRVIITPILDGEGRIDRIIETARPITDIVLQRRKIEESERRFRQFIENAHDMITIKDLSGRYLVINQPAAALFNKSPDEYLGRTDHELFDLATADILTEPDHEVIERKAYLGASKVLTIQGEKRYLDTFHFPLFDYKGDVIGVSAICRDVTEQRLIQKMAVQSEKMAAVGKLAASVAHEINNPLTGVLAFAEEMRLDAQERDPGDDIIHDFDLIIRETMRCREIVAQLLDYARLGPTESQPMNVNVVIERSLGLIRRQALFQNVQLERDLTDDLPSARFVPTQIQQVFINLIINAAEALGYKGKILVRSRLSTDGGFVEASVLDNGPGIPENILPMIFDPFFSTKGTQGTGQGLSIAKAILEQHGGRIFARNREEGGADFTLRLPVDRLARQENFV